MDLKPFGSAGKCPKCGAMTRMLRWQVVVNLEIRQERIQIQCASCGYTWYELPLDATPEHTCAECNLKVRKTIEPQLYECAYRGDEFTGDTPACDRFEPMPEKHDKPNKCINCMLSMASDVGDWLSCPVRVGRFAADATACDKFVEPPTPSRPRQDEPATPPQPELKPCPWCKSIPIARTVPAHNATYFMRQCDNDECPVKPYTPVHSTQAEADDAWNRRTP